MGHETMPHVGENDIKVREIILQIRMWVQYLWSRKWILIAAGVIGSVLGLSYSYIKSPRYTATTTFVVESADSKGGLGRLTGMAAAAGIDIGGGAGGLFQGDNILELYKSRQMLVDALLAKVNPDSDELLVDRYLAYTGIKESWKENPELRMLDFRQTSDSLQRGELRLRDSVMTTIANAIRSQALTVEKPDKKLSIVQVNVSSPDEIFSKSFNQNLVQRVNEFYVQTKTKKSNENIAILEAKVDSVRAAMSGAIYSGAKVSDATPNLNPTRQVQRVAPVQEAQFSAETNRAMLAQLLQNLELAKMTLLQEQPLIQLIDQPVYPLPIDKLGKKKGMVLGGFVFGFLTAVCLIILKWYHNIMSE